MANDDAALGEEILHAACLLAFAAHGTARDHAVPLLGLAGAGGRSELVSLDVADLEFSGAGLIVTLRAPRPTRREAA